MATCHVDTAAGDGGGRLRASLELMRPANVLTSVNDGLTGFAISGLDNWQALPWLLLACSSLYAGGVVLNDFFDREIDARERPERPIPSGRISAGSAAWMGAGCLLLGILAAFRVNLAAGAIGTAIAICVLLYDALGKHHALLGPANMGACRGLNLMLGMSAVPAALAGHWWLSGLSFLYIGGVTALSRGEVHGGKQPVAIFSLSAVIAVLAGLAAMAIITEKHTVWSLMPTQVLAWRVLPPFYKAVGEPVSGVIRIAVRTGVLSLGLLDAALATAYAGPLYGMLVVAVALLAVALARLFAVT